MTRAFRSGARPSPSRDSKVRTAAEDQGKARMKRAFRSDDAYRVGAKKGGKMNAGLKAYLAKKKKKKGKK